MNRLFSAWADVMRPPDRLPIEDWASQNVKLMDSAQSPEFSIELTPWLREPMQEIADNDNKEIVIVAPVGSGKTTILEGCIPWIVGEESGGTLVALQTNAIAAEWAETRLYPSMKICEPIKKLYPRDRHKVRKNQIIFPHMPLLIGGANMSNFQTRSMRWVFLDEAWMYKQGLIEEARRRTHDRWNSRVVMMSQAGVVKDVPWTDEMGSPELDEAWTMTDQRVLNWHCDNCQKYHEWEWKYMRYSEGLEEGETERNWEQVTNSVKLVCPTCEAEYHDEPLTRRKLADGSKYIATNDKNAAGKVGFTYAAQVVWWIKWGVLATEWLKAQDAKRRGDLKPLRQFIQKRQAKPWNDSVGFEKVDLIGAGYLKSEYANGTLIDEELHRLMAVDVQSAGGRHFWAVIRAFRANGTSRLVWEGRIETWEILEEIQKQNGVKPALTFIDGQHMPQEVKERCALYGYNMLHGSHIDRFPHRMRSGKGTVKVDKLYSPMGRHQVGHKYVKYWKWANTPAKDMLATLRANEGLDWEIPDDASDQYHRQMKAEVKRDVVNKTTKKLERKWVKTNNDNHLWDCESMIIAAAVMLKFIQDHSFTE